MTPRNLRLVRLRLTDDFVCRWITEYDLHYEGTPDDEGEQDLKQWIRDLPEPKYLDRRHFIRLGRWKTPRQIHAYKENDDSFVREVTALAYQASDELLKLHILTVLKGVSVAVAATILHFFHPDDFPIFDVRARTTLKKAGMWERRIDDATVDAWREYVDVMRRLSRRSGFTLREMDKALYAYDRWGKE